MKRTSRELGRISRDILNNRYRIPMGAFVAAGLITAVIRLPFSSPENDFQTVPQLVITLLAEFLIMLISQVLRAGVVQVHLNMTRAKEFHLLQIFNPFRAGTDRYFGASFLLCILFILCCLPFTSGSVYFYLTDTTAFSICVLALSGLLSLALILLLLLNYTFVLFFLLDYPQMKVMSAFGECRKMMKGNQGRFLILLTGFAGYGALIVCSLGLASLWAAPYMTQTLVTFYLDCTCELDRIPVRDYGFP